MLANIVRMGSGDTSVTFDIYKGTLEGVLVYKDKRNLTGSGSIRGSIETSLAEITINGEGRLTLYMTVAALKSGGNAYITLKINGEKISDFRTLNTRDTVYTETIEVKKGDVLELLARITFRDQKLTMSQHSIHIDKKVREGTFVGQGEEFHK